MKPAYDPIYPKLKDIGAIMNRNGNDLYVLVDHDTRLLIDNYHPIGISYFFSEGKKWANIPCGYNTCFGTIKS